MYCPNCDLRVEAEFTKVTEQAKAQEYEHWFDSDDIRGEYDLDEVGKMVAVANGDGSTTDWQVAARIDICANCAVPIEARTYCHHWDVGGDY